MNDLLTRSVSAVQHHPDAGRADVAEVARRVGRRRARRRTVAAVGVLAVLVPGAVAASRQFVHRSIVTATGTIDAGGLRMGGTAGDFYDLDPAVVPAGWRRVLDEHVIKLGVCTAVEDDADGPLCTETEGPGHPGVSQVRYAPEGASPELKGESTGNSLEVQTMHTSPWFDLDRYVGQLAPLGGRAVTPATVRGHDARSYDGNGPGTPTLTWQERPGLFVSVSGNNLDGARLAAAAETIRLVDVDRLPMPTVVARVDGVSWAGGDNNHPSLLAVRRGDEECVGWGFVDDCSQRPEDRVHVEFSGSSYWTVGAVPSDVTSVDLMATGQVGLGSYATYAVPGFRSRFFRASSPADTPPYRVSFHHTDGPVDSIGLGYAPLRPSTMPDTVDGVQVSEMTQSQTDNGMPYRLFYVPARGARSTSGAVVAIPRCYVLETLWHDAAWCGEITAPVAIASDDIVLVLAPTGWTSDPSPGGMQLGDNGPSDTTWGYAIVVAADQRVFAIAPDGTRTEVPSPVSAQPMPTFDEVTARLTAG